MEERHVPPVERERLSVADGTATLSMAQATVRRDFNSVARQQQVARTHGGVVAASIA